MVTPIDRKSRHDINTFHRVQRREKTLSKDGQTRTKHGTRFERGLYFDTSCKLPERERVSESEREKGNAFKNTQLSRAVYKTFPRLYRIFHTNAGNFIKDGPVSVRRVPRFRRGPP